MAEACCRDGESAAAGAVALLHAASRTLLGMGHRALAARGLEVAEALAGGLRGAATPVARPTITPDGAP